MTSRIVKVSTYNPNWPHLFESEAERIKHILGANCYAVHHIGSTAVPDLPSKPIIDMIPVVHDITQVDEVSRKMEALGYTAKGEYGMLFRRFFQKSTDDLSSNVHVYAQGNPEIDRHLMFRDWMRNNPDDRHAYAALKNGLANEFPNDIDAYCMGKDAFVASIDTKTGFNGLRCVEALTPFEWAAYHRIRAEQIFNPINVLYDPNHPTITDKNHFHFVLYQGTKIVSVAHVEFLDEHMAALRSIATDEPFKSHGFGAHLMKLIEEWIVHQKRRTLKMHARLSAENFYRNLGYEDMPFDDPCIQDDYVDLGKFLKAL